MASSSADDLGAARVGQLLGGKWTLESLIGTGGMAAVYAGRAPDGTRAAVKILHPEMSLRADVRERFLREGYAANRVQHAGAVQVLEHGYDEERRTAFLVMELLEGESLGDRIRRGVPALPELLDYLDQTLDVLAVAHAAGVVHRDLKPDNLFVTREGRVEVLDFGLARFLDAVPGEIKTKTGIAMGTLPYMAPEQALGRRDEIDARTDIFALGAMTFRILSGRRVHEAASEAELLMAMAMRPAPPLASVVPAVPAGVCAIVDLALAFARDARYPDATTMQKDVRAVARGEPPPYAGARTQARDEATRADRQAPIVVAAGEVERSGRFAGTAHAGEAGAPRREPTVVAAGSPVPAMAGAESAQATGPVSMAGYESRAVLPAATPATPSASTERKTPPVLWFGLAAAFVVALLLLGSIVLLLRLRSASAVNEGLTSSGEPGPGAQPDPGTANQVPAEAIATTPQSTKKNAAPAVRAEGERRDRGKKAKRKGRHDD